MSPVGLIIPATSAANAAAPQAAPLSAPPPAPAPKTDPKKTKVASQWKHSAPVFGCRYEPQGRFIFTFGQDYLVTRWEVASGKSTPLAGHESWARALAFSLDGETTITGGCDGRVIWWPTAAEKPEPLRKIDAHAGWVRAVAVSPKGDVLATCGNDQLVKLWRLADGELLNTFAGHENHVYSLLFCAGGEMLLSGDLLGRIHQWEIASGKLARTFNAEEMHLFDKGFMAHYGGVLSMTQSAAGDRLACGGLQKCTNAFGAVQEPFTVVFEWESQKIAQRHAAAGDFKGVTRRALYHPDGYLFGLADGTSGGSLMFWKPEEANEFHRFNLPSRARDCDLSPDGLSVATAHVDHFLRVSRLADAPPA